MTVKTRFILYAVLSGFFLFLDQWLKWQATHGWKLNRLMGGGWFGWEPFFNNGVAFSIPVPSLLVISFTLPVIVIMAYLLTHELKKITGNGKKHEERVSAIICIIAGALSNLIDRVQFHYTIDYVRILTAVINIGDVLIVVGFLLYLLSLRQENKETV